MTASKKFVYYYNIKISFEELEKLHYNKMNLADLLLQKVLAHAQIEYINSYN